MKSTQRRSRMHPTSPRQRAHALTRARGFTLAQILLVMAFVAILSAVVLGLFGQSRQSARRAECDMKLKAITMALDAFRQETGAYPERLNQLVSRKYLTDVQMLRCPSDPRQVGSLGDYYVMRWGRDSGELPILVCPLCAKDSDQGLQAFKGRYTKQFATRPAQITQVAGATVERPGKNPIAARSGMQLRGGDIIRTADGGSAVIRFADGSTSNLSGKTEITLLQSFIAGHSHAPLYTLLRQTAGDVSYKVHHGSKFDVSTPTATAGALGTAFQITEDATGIWWLKVTESMVLVSDLEGSDIYAAETVNLTKRERDGVTITQSSDWTPLGQSEVTTTTTTTTSGTTATNTTKKIKVPRGKATGWNRDS